MLIVFTTIISPCKPLNEDLAPNPWPFLNKMCISKFMDLLYVLTEFILVQFLNLVSYLRLT